MILRRLRNRRSFSGLVCIILALLGWLASPVLYVHGAFPGGSDTPSWAAALDTLHETLGQDCNSNGIADSEEIAAGTSSDCNDNEVPDDCDISAGTSSDTNGDGVPDECLRIMFVDAGATGQNDGSSWADAFTNLQAALTLANQSSELRRELWVAEGTYHPAPTGGSRAATFFLGAGLAMYGGFSGVETKREQRDHLANPTILSGDLNGDDESDFVNTGDNSFHVVTISHGFADPFPVVLDGFTVIGGNADGATTSQKRGGAVYLNCGRPLIANCRFTGNTSASFGGGVAVECGSPRIEDCEFTLNRSLSSGGAIFSAGWIEIQRCLFTSNSAGGAGAIYDSAGLANIRGCTFVGNSATLTSGGVGGALAFDDGSPIVIGCEFRDNLAYTGGAFYHYIGDPVFSDCLFVNNRSIGNWGGAGYLASGAAKFVNCSFIGNTTAVWGGAIYVFGGFGPTDHMFQNCVFSGNRPTGQLYGSNGALVQMINCTLSGYSTLSAAGALTLNNNSAGIVTNCVLWGNTNASGSGESAQIRLTNGATATVSYSTVQGWTGALGGVGNSGDDPRLADIDGPDGIPGTDDDDLRLTDWSPAIDAGLNSAVLADFADLDGDGDTGEPTPLDLDGRPRFVDDPATADTGGGPAPVVDRGAYEFQPNAPAATLQDAVSRKSCDLSLMLTGGVTSESRRAGIDQLVLGFDAMPGQPGPGAILIEQQTCAMPDAFVPYTGASTALPQVDANQLVVSFSPPLENARRYRLRLGSTVTSVTGQALEVRALTGDVNSDGWVNASDRSVLIGVWTGGGFTCPTDLNDDGTTNALDRGILIGAWTGGANCAP